MFFRVLKHIFYKRVSFLSGDFLCLRGCFPFTNFLADDCASGAVLLASGGIAALSVLRSSLTGDSTWCERSMEGRAERGVSWLSEWTISPPSIYSRSSGRMSVFSNEWLETPCASCVWSELSFRLMRSHRDGFRASECWEPRRMSTLHSSTVDPESPDDEDCGLGPSFLSINESIGEDARWCKPGPELKHYTNKIN